MSTEILETSPLYREWVQKAHDEGKAEGIREAVLIILRNRFGELPLSLVAAINAATPSQLQDVLAYAVTDTLEQVATRLSQPPA